MNHLSHSRRHLSHPDEAHFSSLRLLSCLYVSIIPCPPVPPLLSKISLNSISELVPVNAQVSRTTSRSFNPPSLKTFQIIQSLLACHNIATWFLAAPNASPASPAEAKVSTRLHSSSSWERCATPGSPPISSRAFAPSLSPLGHLALCERVGAFPAQTSDAVRRLRDLFGPSTHRWHAPVLANPPMPRTSPSLALAYLIARIRICASLSNTGYFPFPEDPWQMEVRRYSCLKTTLINGHGRRVRTVEHEERGEMGHGDGRSVSAAKDEQLLLLV
ncbi:hypothetical protein B0H19DRAFT_1375741 [Mycena capillaripes]|nr:hypothetical protein B0H19DRAFT_1375741 [Mycena capillaripes]